MDDLGKNLFTCTTLSGDQDSQVSRGNLPRDINRPVQQGGVADNTEPLFDSLDFLTE